ncbi:LLM class flavin-dependent oxidoreductase [Antarcticimicrobium sediminis]|uniref:LLM class flavin-dependent oxidoreductase n=1 Tax=Antarcticimicrobium sediminis TaxID=2546227 RepID=A0A4R5EPR2_9RHOB|nr:LLM class flavin-dependent oxidoreductase [Antarcticimicrobium sediminis]TDE36721.1 LLM class flavin-dependent oxidoreductase [Antarcticimicrobium sediminis]
MKQLRLGLSMFRMGYHVAAWRHPGNQPDGSMDLAYFRGITQAAEAAKFDLVFMADELAIRGADNPAGSRCRSSHVAELEPITLLSALAPLTERIGLVSTGSTTYSEPFNLARQVLSLDHMSGGRAGWNVVTSWGKEDALNFGHMDTPDYDTRYDRASEFVDVVRGLWNSFDADAFIRDQKSGIFYDPDKMHELNHQGQFFSVRGPLHMARSPQGEPVIFFAGDSEAGRAVAARAADVVFTAKQDLADAQAFYASIKDRLPGLGRDDEDLLIMPGLMPIVGRTKAEAQAKYDALQALIDPRVGLASLYDRLGDLSDYDLDGPVPEPKDPAFRSRAEGMYKLAQREGYTIRQLYTTLAAGRGHRMVIGTGEEIADEMQLWLETRAADGFNIIPTHLPDALNDFTELVLPDLQNRGLFRTEYEGATLRENLGLPVKSLR